MFTNGIRTMAVRNVMKFGTTTAPSTVAAAETAATKVTNHVNVPGLQVQPQPQMNPNPKRGFDYHKAGMISGAVGALAYIVSESAKTKRDNGPVETGLLVSLSSLGGMACAELFPPLAPFFGVVFLPTIVNLWVAENNKTK